MKQGVLVLACCFAFIFNARPQNFSKAVNNAFLISRMVEKYHIQPRNIDSNFSNDWFDAIFTSLDEDKIFFTAQDYSQLNAYHFKLQDQLKQQKSNFIQLLYNLYLLRLHQIDSMLTSVCNTPFNFTSHEFFTIKEDTSFAPDEKFLKIKLSKYLKLQVLNNIISDEEEETFKDAAERKKYTDSIEIALRKKEYSFYKRLIKRRLENINGGLENYIASIYCKTLAECYDPHTEYFDVKDKEDFEGSIGNKRTILGVYLEENDNGQVIVTRLKPGSPAYKCGLINKGDRIIALQWEGKDKIDVSDAGVEEVSEILDENHNNTVTITVKKADGSVKQVPLTKEKEADDISETAGKVKSFLLKGNKTIGFISLPDFYTDWKDRDTRNEGCASDVSKEIIKLKEEKIEGLILDLRYNGGGSMKEASELSGIFIDAGPVGQLVQKSGKVYTLKDVNRGTIYDGPLMVLVNGYSASASEAFAGTLQDYNRAIIAGSPTFGKATAQVIFPLDTTINTENASFLNRQYESYIKLTIEKLYRVTGKTAQQTGVIPDVILPEIEGEDSEREENFKCSLKAPAIDANKYFKPYTAIDIAPLQIVANKITDTAAFFKTVTAYNKLIKQQSAEKDIELNLQSALNNNKDSYDIDDELSDLKLAPTNLYAVKNNAYEETRLQADKDSSTTNNLWKKHLLKDPYVQAAYQILSSFIK